MRVYVSLSRSYRYSLFWLDYALLRLGPLALFILSGGCVTLTSLPLALLSCSGSFNPNQQHLSPSPSSSRPAQGLLGLASRYQRSRTTAHTAPDWLNTPDQNLCRGSSPCSLHQAVFPSIPRKWRPLHTSSVEAGRVVRGVTSARSPSVDLSTLS